MNQDPKPTRGMPRSLIFAMIPAGFVLLVVILIVTGWIAQEAAVHPPVVVPDPGPVQQPGMQPGQPAQPLQ
jgi:TRAP-type C4-dicarboxylate transport system permease small subunit